MLKLLKISTAVLISLSSTQIFADQVEDEYKLLVTSQPTYAKFQKNFDDILGKMEDLTQRANQTGDKIMLYPMCVAMQSTITILKNNKKFKAEFDKDYKQFGTSYNDTLATASKGLNEKKQMCEDGKKYYFAN